MTGREWDFSGLPVTSDAAGTAAAFWVQAVPAAGRSSAVLGMHGDAVRVRVGAPAVDGKANAALVEYLAGALGLPRAAVSITTGQRSRRKRITVSGITSDTVRARLAAIAAP